MGAPVPPTGAVTAAGDVLADVERALTDVELALSRIEAGSYGRCEACGAELDDAVLALSPTATRCHEHDGGPAPAG